MNLLLVPDGHYIQSSDGQVYSESVYNYSFFKRYLSSFDHIYVVVRISHSDIGIKRNNLCSGEGVSFLPLPAFTGPWQYIKNIVTLRKIIRRYCADFDCAIFRLPGATPNLVCRQFSSTGKPFAIEVVADPWDNFSPGAIHSVLRPLIRVYWTLFLKRMCKQANGVSYVTEHYLQNRYPSRAVVDSSSSTYFESFYSSVDLPDNSISSPRDIEPKEPYKILHVSNAFTGYGKGHIVLMDSFQKVLQDGFKAELCFVGDGPLRPAFESYARRLEINDSVHFTGRLAGSSEVRAIMRQSDLFVFPTLAEGLPRVLLEAMAEGLPCISTSVCGIPEILDNSFMCDYHDSDKLTELIELFLSSPDLMISEGKRNLSVARKYSTSILSERRNNFYSSLRALTQQQ